MSMNCSGNHARAARIARQIVRPFDVGDVESFLTEKIECEELDKICVAIDPDYVQYREGWVDCLHDATANYYSVRERAMFHLGFAAAVRLLGNGRQSS